MIMRHCTFQIRTCLIVTLFTLSCGSGGEQTPSATQAPVEVPMPIPGRPHIKRPLFVATGSEPAWSVSVFQDTVRFTSSLPGMGDLMAATPPPDVLDKGGRRYLLATRAGELIIDISSEPCTDARSGAHRPNTTRITLQPQGSSAPTVLNGCGRWLTKEALEQGRSE